MEDSHTRSQQADNLFKTGEIWNRLTGVLENLPTENINNIVRDLDELEERWNNSLAFGGPFTKYYSDGRLDILVRCRIRGGEKFYVLFRAQDIGNVGGRQLRVDVANSLPKRRLTWTCDGGPYHCERSVFVFNIQIMKQTEASVPSFAWVQPIDNVADFLTGTLYFSDRIGWQTVAGRENREAGFTIGRAVIEDHGLINHVIEGRSEVVNAISDNQAPFDRDAGFELASSLRITITDEKIGAFLADGGDAIAQVIDVMYGPFDLGSRAQKRV